MLLMYAEYAKNLKIFRGIAGSVDILVCMPDNT